MTYSYDPVGDLHIQGSVMLWRDVENYLVRSTTSLVIRVVAGIVFRKGRKARGFFGAFRQEWQRAGTGFPLLPSRLG
jgi:hypothetical protein